MCFFDFNSEEENSSTPSLADDQSTKDNDPAQKNNSTESNEKFAVLPPFPQALGDSGGHDCL